VGETWSGFCAVVAQSSVFVLCGPSFIFHIFALAVVKGCVGVAKVLPYILNMLVRPCWPVAAAKRKSG